jgi:predicted RNase H-like nuclease (RuvC/YqgF family)
MREARRSYQQMQEGARACKDKLAVISTELARVKKAKSPSVSESSPYLSDPPDASLANPDWHISAADPPVTSLIRENAKLRGEIADREAANAKLSDDLETLRQQMASLELSQSTSSSLDEVLKSKDDAIHELRAELKGAKATARENSKLSQENAAIHEALSAQKSELRRAKRELDRLSRIADSLSPSGSPQGPIPHYESHHHSDKKYHRVKDQNSALRAEVDYLRLKNDELSDNLSRERHRSHTNQIEERELDRLRREVIHLRQAAKPPPIQLKPNEREVLAASIRTSVQRRSANFILKMHIFESKITTELDAIDVRMGKLRTAYYQVKLLQNRRFPVQGRHPDSQDFLAHLGRSVRSIEALSHAYARSYNFPCQNVPAATDLIANHHVLKRFIRSVESGAHEFPEV